MTNNKKNKSNIKLQFPDKTLTRIAGNPLGVKIWKEIENQIDWETVNTIVLPQNLKSVSSSFVQGFISAPSKRVGLPNLDKILEFKCENENVVKQIQNSINISAFYDGR